MASNHLQTIQGAHHPMLQLALKFVHQNRDLENVGKRHLHHSIHWYATPPPSNSHHQDYDILSRESLKKPSLNCYCLGGYTKSIQIILKQLLLASGAGGDILPQIASSKGYVKLRFEREVDT